MKRFTFNRITMQALKRIELCSLKRCMKREKFYYFINIKIKNIKRNKNKTKKNTNDTK